jgi:small-conductance mechanosensitive channel
VELSDRTVTALVTAGVGILLVLLVRFGLRYLLERYTRRAEVRRSPGDVAALRTRLTVLTRVIVAFVTLIVLWNFLAIFPTTAKIGNALLASSAVLALLAGLAFTVPLGNLGAGILLAFSQPVRLGDRITIGDVTGTTDEITLLHTVLITDDERRVYVPNNQMVSSVVVNRSVLEPRRVVSVDLPIALSAPLERARAAVLDAVATVPGADQLDVHARLGNIEEKTAWLTLTAYAPTSMPAGTLGADLRERALEALAREQLLPT